VQFAPKWTSRALFRRAVETWECLPRPRLVGHRIFEVITRSGSWPCKNSEVVQPGSLAVLFIRWDRPQ
jgi:hypothetical protein